MGEVHFFILKSCHNVITYKPQPLTRDNSSCENFRQCSFLHLEDLHEIFNICQNKQNLFFGLTPAPPCGLKY